MDATLWATALGGLIGIGGSLATIRAGRKSAILQSRRDELRGACADLLTACDDLWAADERVHLAVFTMVNYESRTDAGRDERDAANQDRLAAFAQHAEANNRARRARDVITLVAPKLDPAARSLFEASSFGTRRGSPLPTGEEKGRKETARLAFVTDARKYL